MIDSFSLEYPYIILSILLFILCAWRCKAKIQSLIFPNLQTFEKVQASRSSLLFMLKWLAIVMSIVALSGPVLENKFETGTNRGYDIALLLDASVSMSDIGFDAQNPRKNKFMVVQEAAADFIKKRENDNMALVVFGEYAFVASPLTFDKNSLADILARLGIGIAGRSTAINDAIALSVKILEPSKAQSKVAILLTDGMNTAGNIPENVAVGLAKKAGIKIYTIGIGGPNDFDQFALTGIAKETGGKFYQARNSLILKKVYEEIDRLEKSEIKSNQYIKKEHLYMYPLFIAFVSLLIYVYIRNRKGM